MIVFSDLLSDVSVLTDSLPITLDNVQSRGVLWQVAGERFLLDVPEVARYLVEAGSSITIEPAPDALPQTIEHFLRMLPLAALVYQRGMLAFHAAAVTNGEYTVLLAGNSGSGKSTILAALLQRGWAMMTDDLAIVALDEQGQPTVYPSRAGIALWPDSLNNLGIASDSFSYCDANRKEYPVHGHFDNKPRTLRGIYRLNVNNKSEVAVEELEGSARFQMIGTLLYNSQVADALCNRSDYLRSVATIAQKVQSRDLSRPRGIWSVKTLIDHVLNNSGIIL